jgi:hypothetical protein
MEKDEFLKDSLKGAVKTEEFVIGQIKAVKDDLAKVATCPKV